MKRLSKYRLKRKKSTWIKKWSRMHRGRYGRKVSYLSHIIYSN